MRATTQLIAQALPGHSLREVLPVYESAGRGATYCVRGGLSRVPECGCGRLQPRGFLTRPAECDRCGRAFDKTVAETLMQVVALPKALGKHPCECGHPEMRRLPDGVFHCPACRAEVLPVSIPEPRPVAASRSLAAFERVAVSPGTPRRKGIGGADAFVLVGSYSPIER